MSATTIKIEDKTISAAGLTLRYLDSGSGTSERPKPG